MTPIDIRAYDVYGCSPVTTAQRPISMLIQSCRKTPSAAAQIITAPNLAVTQGHTASSPAPIARPIMIAPGPASCQKDSLRAGRFSSRSGGMGTGMWRPPAGAGRAARQLLRFCGMTESRAL